LRLDQERRQCKRAMRPESLVAILVLTLGHQASMIQYRKNNENLPGHQVTTSILLATRTKSTAGIRNVIQVYTVGKNMNSTPYPIRELLACCGFLFRPWEMLYGGKRNTYNGQSHFILWMSAASRLLIDSKEALSKELKSPEEVQNNICRQSCHTL
jgi:hypothetical protein